MKKKTIIISGIATVLVIGSVVFCFAVKGDSTQPTEVAQTVTEAVATPTVEIPEEVVEEVPEVEVAEVVEETPEEVPEVQETSEEVSSIVEVAETTEEDEDAGVSTPEVEETEPTQPEKAEQTEQVAQVTETNPKVNQITTDQAVADALAKLDALGAEDGIPSSTSTLGECPSSGGAAAQIIVE